jgi:hypothetical protein
VESWTYTDATDGLSGILNSEPLSDFGVTVTSNGVPQLPTGDSVTVVDGVAELSSQSSGPIGAILDQSGNYATESGGALTSGTDSSALEQANFRCGCKFTWGIISGTVYFNLHETAVLALSTVPLGLIAPVLPPPFDFILLYSATVIGVTAGLAGVVGDCVYVKSYGVVGQYSGGFCS